MNIMKPIKYEDGYISFFCQGCNGPHRINVIARDTPMPVWGWNGDMEKPEFTPSVLVRWEEPANLYEPEKMQADLAAKREKGVPIPLAQRVCHSFVGNNGAAPGQIVFLSDCTHKLAGKVVDLPEWESSWNAWGNSL